MTLNSSEGGRAPEGGNTYISDVIHQGSGGGNKRITRFTSKKENEDFVWRIWWIFGRWNMHQTSLGLQRL